MKEIVVLSGKGGVGKSSVTSSLGCLLGSSLKVCLADTDVDAPNLDLVLGAVLRESQEIASSEKAVIDYEKCTGCMSCLGVCRFSSIIDTGKPLVVTFSCEGCGSCALVCPEGAIEIRKKVNGRINTFEAGDLLIVSGELIIGESSSGHLVDEVKKRARSEADNRGADILLIDGPPGIGCPVISSVKGADYVVAVTEPTPSAMSDLVRLADLIGYFKIPVGLVINKADMHAGTVVKLKEFAGEKGFDLLAEIPYDLAVPKAVAEAKPVVTAYPDSPASSAIGGLAEEVAGKLR